MPRNSKHSPRIAPVEPPYDDDTAEALEALGPPIMLFRMFARSPDRARAIHSWGSYYLSRRSALSLRHRELVIDRTTALCGAEYEWAIHVDAFAAKAGLTDAQVRSLARGTPDDPCWEAGDRAVLHAVDALHGQSDLADAVWSDLVAAAGEDGSLDVLLLAGWYHAISFAARGLRLPLEPGTTGFPAL